MQQSKGAFDDHPGFYQLDNRRLRGFNPISKNFLESKFSVLLPVQMVAGKRVLDLGSCLGAAGQWALFHGAAEYTGVEVQAAYVEQSRALLAHWHEQVSLHQQDVRGFLQATDTSYDIVLLAGMLYHFIDTKTIVDAACRVCREQVIVETNFPPGMRSGKIPMDMAVTEYVSDQEVNLADTEASLLGIAATTSLPALDLLFSLNGFYKNEACLDFPLSSDTLIYDQSLLGDTQLQIRFAARYYHHPQKPANATLEENLPQRKGAQRRWDDATAGARSEQYRQRAQSLDAAAASATGPWKFDAQVAQQFADIARREIPDYLRVIDLCIDLIKKDAREQPKIIDVGSAVGETLQRLYTAGFRDLYGVESSAEMLSRSFEQAVLIESQQFPLDAGPFDYVLANWVLHFIPERYAYLQSIMQGLSPGGTLILTEKVSASERSDALYYDMKRMHGISEEQIEAKRRSLHNVLVTRPLAWYLQTLDELGFIDIEIINAAPAFMTFAAVKAQ